MTERNDIVERRKQDRFKVKAGVFAVLMSNPPTLAQVKEISEGGLTVRYFGGERSEKISELDIFVSDSDFHLSKAPFETTSNFDVTIEFPESVLKMKQRGFKFGPLSFDQKSQLDYLLQNHAIDK